MNFVRYVWHEECVCDGVFIVKPSSFIITDDLRVTPIATGILDTLNKLGITDIEGAKLQYLNLILNDMSFKIMCMFYILTFSVILPLVLLLTFSPFS